MSTDEDNERLKYQIEFSNPKVTRDAKNELMKKFDKNILKIYSALQQVII